MGRKTLQELGHGPADCTACGGKGLSTRKHLGLIASTSRDWGQGCGISSGRGAGKALQRRRGWCHGSKCTHSLPQGLPETAMPGRRYTGTTELCPAQDVTCGG